MTVRMKKIGIMVAILLLVSLSYIGRYPGDKKEEPHPSLSKDPVVLNYYTWDEEAFYMEDIVETFNARHPSIQVKAHFLVNDQYEEEIANRIDAGEDLDIIGIRGISKLVYYQDMGYLTDLTTYIQNGDMDVTPYGNMYNNITIDGHYYAMPTRSTCWVLVYNKDIFETYHIAYPEQMSWEEYRDLANELKSQMGDKGYGGYLVDWSFNFLGIQRGNYLYDDDLSGVISSLLWFNTLTNEDGSHPTVLEMEEGEYWLSLFEEGKIGMMPQGEWTIGMLLNDQAKGVDIPDWDLAPLPVGKEQRPGTTWGQYQFTGLTTTCNDQEAAFQFLEFVSGEEGARMYAQAGMLSAYQNEASRSIYKTVVGDKNVDVFFDAYKRQEQPLYKKYEILDEAFTREARAYLIGEQSLEEAMAQFEKERMKILQQ